LHRFVGVEELHNEAIVNHVSKLQRHGLMGVGILTGWGRIFARWHLPGKERALTG